MGATSVCHSWCIPDTAHTQVPWRHYSGSMKHSHGCPDILVRHNPLWLPLKCLRHHYDRRLRPCANTKVHRPLRPPSSPQPSRLQLRLRLKSQTTTRGTVSSEVRPAMCLRRYPAGHPAKHPAKQPARQTTMHPPRHPVMHPAWHPAPQPAPLHVTPLREELTVQGHRPLCTLRVAVLPFARQLDGSSRRLMER